ncbi:MAG: hypothetical protein ACJAR8_000690 [Bacteroidia bacterium]|jgi:hypothetical protein
MIEKSCHFKGFWAPENKGLCAKFSLGHENVLRDHGFSHFKSNEKSWHNENSTFVIVALNDAEVVGGIRLERRKGRGTLALEKAILPIDDKVCDFLDALPTKVILETCGLWNARSVAGLNISQYLTRLGTVIAPLIDKNAISFCFNARYTFRITRSLGYHIVNELGDDGYMNYPTPDFKAALWMNDDLYSLKSASSEEKERILSLREDLFQSYFEQNKRGGINIKYEINL